MGYPIRPKLPADLPCYVVEYIEDLEGRVHHLQKVVEQNMRYLEERSDFFALHMQ